MIKLLKLGLSGIFIVIILMWQNCCWAVDNKVYQDEKIIPHLFAYKRDYLLKMLQRSGHGDISPFQVSRNNSGTSLYFQREYGEHKGDKILVISKNADLKTVIAPANITFLNDNGEFVAWFDNVQNGVTFRNGALKQVPLFSRFDVDPSGEFYFIEVQPGVTEIGTTEKPDKTLITLHMKGYKIFTKNNKIYIFDYFTLIDRVNCKNSIIICDIIAKSNSDYIVEDEILIPYPSSLSGSFDIVDFDQWSDNVLIKVSRDMPFSFFNAWYLFDLKSKKMTKIGKMRDYGFFLEEDVTIAPAKEY